MSEAAYFTFVGDPRMAGKDNTEKCDIFGMTFPAGKSIEVKDAAVAERLRRHDHFKETGRVGRPPKAD